MPYDGRSLYERLKEQKDKKDTDFEETHKLSEYTIAIDKETHYNLYCPCVLQKT